MKVARESGINIIYPQTIMSDFELAIINAVRTHFGRNIIRLCLFHLCQSVYRRIQQEGLLRQYGDETDSSIRDAARTMCALAFVPPDDVAIVFRWRSISGIS